MKGKAEGRPAQQSRLHAHLFTNGSRHGDREGPDIPSAQVLALPLVAEELQLPLLLLVQGVAVSDLKGHRGGTEESLFALPLRIPEAQASVFSANVPLFGLDLNPARLGDI